MKNVASHLVAGLAPNYPLVLVGMLPHEQRMSVMNLVLKRSVTSRDQQAIPCKERLIFHCGYRRFTAAPTFSQHTAANKHKVLYASYFGTCECFLTDVALWNDGRWSASSGRSLSLWRPCTRR